MLTGDSPKTMLTYTGPGGVMMVVVVVGCPTGGEGW